jgi:hypothetical protein
MAGCCCCFLLLLMMDERYIQDEDASKGFWQLLATPLGPVTVACMLLSLIAMAPFLLIETGSMLSIGVGWFNLWNGIDIITYVLQVSVSWFAYLS